MSFARPEVLWLLALLPFLAYAVVRAAAAARERALAFSIPSATRLRGSGDGPAPGGASAANVGLGLSGVAVAMLVLAAAGPQVGVSSQEVPAPGVDVVIGLDASRSMWTRDVHPNRLARAQREIEDLADQVKGARFGLVSIGGAGALVAPLSRDRRALAELVQSVNPTLLRTPGTDLAAGLSRCVAAFDPDSPAARAVVLFSDGGHQGDERSLQQAARAARDVGVTVHAVLVGLAAGGVVPVSEDDPAPLLDRSGAPVRSAGSRAALAVITEATGGALVEIEREPFPAVALAARGFAGAGPSTGTGVIRQVPVDRYRWFVIAAGVAAALGWALRRGGVFDRGLASPRRRARDRAGALSQVPEWVPASVRSLRAMALVGLSLIAAGGPGAPADRSVEALERALKARPDDVALRYNLGVARTRAGDLDGAEAAFSAVLQHGALQAAAPEIAARCRHGRGVVRAVRAERLEGAARARALFSAVDDFAAALSIGSGPVGDRALQADAAWNLEWVTLRLLAQQNAGGPEFSGTGAGRSNDDSRTGEGVEDSGSGEDRPGVSADGAAAANAGVGSTGQGEQNGSAEVGDATLAADPEGAADEGPGEGRPAPHPPAVDRGRNIVEIIARFAAERRAYDVRAARASRVEAENDW